MQRSRISRCCHIEFGSTGLLWKHKEQLGRRQRRVPEVDQLVRIQLPSVEDGEGFLRNIRFKNVSVVEQV